MAEREALHNQRKKIDNIDEQILDLLKKRSEVSQDVVRKKIEKQLPIFVANRELEKTRDFREKAVLRGLDPEWAEDFLRMIMAASRASQSSETFPRSTDRPMHILFAG